MTDQLSLYNGALRLIGERRLSTINEDREPRHVLDEVWFDPDGSLAAVESCLEDGLWNFASVAQEITYDTLVVPRFGFQYAYAKPVDWVRTAMLCTDEYYQQPLLAYQDEGIYWYTDASTIYLQYISKAESRGRDYSRWPKSFARYVECWLASEVCERLTQNASKRELLEKELRKRLLTAKSRDAMNDPTRMMPKGNWERSRSGPRGELGRRDRLIG